MINIAPHLQIQKYVRLLNIFYYEKILCRPGIDHPQQGHAKNSRGYHYQYLFQHIKHESFASTKQSLGKKYKTCYPTLRYLQCGKAAAASMSYKFKSQTISKQHAANIFIHSHPARPGSLTMLFVDPRRLLCIIFVMPPTDWLRLNHLNASLHQSNRQTNF